MGYSFNIQYRSTNNFGQADGLSRLPIGPDAEFDKEDSTESHTIDLVQCEHLFELPLRASDIARATRRDPILVRVYHYVLSGWPDTQIESLSNYYKIRNELTISNGCIMWNLRTIIPLCHRNYLLQFLHLSHPGMTRMKMVARRYLWWPLIDKEIEDLVRKCPNCMENSKQPIKAPLALWPSSDQPWKRIHIDYMGKFMNLFFLVVVDAYSKWLEVIPMHNTTTMATITALSSLFARYGLCETIVSDNGTQFTAKEFSDFCACNGIQHLTTSPGHPQSNGQAERYVDTIKSALTKGCRDGGRITDVLQTFLFSYRATPHSTTDASPAELFLKRQFRTVLDLLRSNEHNLTSIKQNRYKINFDKHSKQRSFKQDDKVVVRDFRNTSNKVKWAPGILIDRQGSRLWHVQVGNHVWRRHENQIKLREYSSDDDIILMDSSMTREIISNKLLSTNSSSDNGSTILRRSARQPKPMKRLIEEI